MARRTRGLLSLGLGLCALACRSEGEAVFVSIPWAEDSWVVLGSIAPQGSPSSSLPPRLIEPSRDHEKLSGVTLEVGESLLALEYSAGSRGARGLDLCKLGTDVTHALAPVPNHAFAARLEEETSVPVLEFESVPASLAWRPHLESCDGTPCDGLRIDSLTVDVNVDVERVATLRRSDARVAIVYNLKGQIEGRVTAVEYPGRVLWTHSSTGAAIGGAAIAAETIFLVLSDGTRVELDPSSGAATRFEGRAGPLRLATHPGGFALGFSETGTTAFELRPSGGFAVSALPMPGPRKNFVFGTANEVAAWSDRDVYVMTAGQWQSVPLGTDGDDVGAVQWVDGELYALTGRSLFRWSGVDFVLVEGQTSYVQRTFVPWLDGWLIGGTSGQMVHVGEGGPQCSLSVPTQQTLGPLVELQPGLAVSFVLASTEPLEPVLIWLVDDWQMFPAVDAR